MTGLLLILDADSAAVVAAATGGVGLLLKNERAAVARSWDDGLRQLDAWLDSLIRAGRSVRAEAGVELATAVLWLSALLSLVQDSPQGVTR